jgi:hypothetical protein
MANRALSQSLHQNLESFVDQKQAADYENASINRYLAALRRAFTLGMEALPPLVYSVPKITKLEEDNVREGFLEHHLVCQFAKRAPRSSAASAGDRIPLRHAPRRDFEAAVGPG